MVVVCDMEAGLGTVSRLKPGHIDVVLVVVEPSAKGIEVGRRAVQIATARARVIVIANRVTGEADLEAVAAALEGYELVAVPEEPVILQADREGIAPIDADADAPGVSALRRLAERLVALGD